MNWVNENSNILLVIFSGVYGVTTIAILLAMLKSNKLLRASLLQTAELERARTRPYLSVYIKSVTKDDQDVPYGYIFLKNTGSTQAFSTSIHIEPILYSNANVDGKDQKIVPYFFKHTTPTIAPGVELSDSIGYMPELFETFSPPVFTGTIQYFDLNNIKYVESFTIDLESMEIAMPYRGS